MIALDPRHIHAAMAMLARADPIAAADESHIRAARSYRFPFAAEDHTYLLMDVLLDVNRRWVVVEVNGSNAAGSSAHDGDVPRVEHFLDTVEARSLDGDVVVVAFQAATPSVSEILTRVVLLASGLQRRLGERVQICGAGGGGNERDVTVVVDTTERLAAELSVTSAGRLKWRDRLVAGASNANVLPALLRKRKIRTAADVDADVFHEGTMLATVADKGLQQTIAHHTGFRPLEWAAAATFEEAVELFASWSATRACVAKMNAGSGGTGVVIVPFGTRKPVAEALLTAAIDDIVRKYGSAETAWPFRVFEFAPALPARHPALEGSRLWDLRLEILVWPGQIVVTPLSARLCPDPYDGYPTNATAVANLSGRSDGATRVLGADELVAAMAQPAWILGEVAQAAARWVINALTGTTCAR